MPPEAFIILDTPLPPAAEAMLWALKVGCLMAPGSFRVQSL